MAAARVSRCSCSSPLTSPSASTHAHQRTARLHLHSREARAGSVTLLGHRGRRTGIVNYHRHDGIIAFTHTEVPPEIEGRGVASALARKALDDARASGDKVVPACEFFAHFMDEHPEYDDLRAA